ncbi:MAG: hypothetical protein AB7O26_15235 [Planctomycetaceae bacterium]
MGAIISKRRGLLSIAIVLMSGVVVAQVANTLVSQARGKSGAAAHSKLDKPIRSMATYLARQAAPDGRFVYRVDLQPNRKFPPRYNILRHAGAIYALAGYHARTPDAAVHDAIIRSGRYLRAERIAPVETNEMLAVWSTGEDSDEEETGVHEAKLGGTGLGLVALLSIEQQQPGETSLNDLRRLGAFLTWMQRPNGSFCSKYVPGFEGKDGPWVSLYYPGEAALGLIMLYEKDPSPKWLKAAADAMAYLAESRAGKSKVEADHWALLATARLLPHYDQLKSPRVTREAIIHHAAQVSESILNSQPAHPENSELHGCFTKDGRTTPTATRLEGLLAALSFLPADQQPLRERIRKSVDDGIAFLVRAHVTDGEFAGAMPHSIHATPGMKFSDPLPRRAGEVRIDYVQHALSALLQYEALDTPAAD